MTRAAMAAAMALAVTLAGCTTAPGGAGPDTAKPAAATAAPVSAARSSAAPPAEVDVTVPLSWSESTLVDTGWLTRPQVRGRFAVGFAKRAGGLEYSGIDSYGTILWRATRPAACTGFAVSTAAGKPIVVLTDAATTRRADGAAWQTTATAYDLATGAAIWGPVAVPGTVQGPGLVFGRSAPAATLGEVGPRLALDPATGRVIADEAATPGLTVVGEYDGTLLTASGGKLTGTEAATGRTLWTVPGTGPAAGNRTPPIGAALLDASGGADVIGLATGATLAAATDSAAYEPLSETWLFATGTTLLGSGVSHDEWSRDLPEPPTIAVAEMGLVYLKSGAKVRVINALTGADAIAYPGDATGRYAVPIAITTDAAALFHVDDRYLIATVQRPPE